MTPHLPALPDGGTLSGGEGEAQFAYLARQTAAQVRVVEATYGFALARRQQGALDEGRRLLASGALLVARFAPDMRAQLDLALDLATGPGPRALVRPLHPRGLRLFSLRALAVLAWPVHVLLLMPRQRLRFKARLLRRAWRELERAADATARRARRRPRAAWDVADLCADVVTLRREALDVFRAVLVSPQGRPAESLALRAAA